MASDASEPRPSCRPNCSTAAAAAQHHHPPPPNSEALPCPRCDSINTKFCYYNNYNLSQPRHFCKSCRRYWTQGGTLRNVPVGGGSRKPSSASSSSSKRLRSLPAPIAASTAPPPTSSPASASSSLTSESVHLPKHAGEVPGAFTSLLTSQGGQSFLALGGFGSPYGPNLDGLALGFNRAAVWPFAEVGYIEGVYSGGHSNLSAAEAAPPCNTWQLGPGESGGSVAGQVEGSDGFAWPELAISMPGQGLK